MENAALLRAIIENAIDGIITIDERGRIESINPAACGLFQREPDEVLGQLCRNLIFAQHLGEPGERALVVNLLRKDSETDVQERFRHHVASDSPVQFRRTTWEEIYALPIMSSDKAKPLRLYLQNKTLSLRKAFNIQFSRGALA